MQHRPDLLCCFSFAIALCSSIMAGEPATMSTQPSDTPTKMDRPFVKLFTLMREGPLNDTSDKTIEYIARNYDWINGHGGSWLKPVHPDGRWEYFAGPSAGRDAQGRTVGERLRAINPEIILSNYRNGPYTSQGALREASEVEKRCPLSIAVFVTGCKLAAPVDDKQTEIRLSPPPDAPEDKPDIYPFKKSFTDQEYSQDKSNYVAWLRLGEEILRIDDARAEDGAIVLTVKRGIWNTTAAAHDTNTHVLEPIYCGRVQSDGKSEYYLSGLPDGSSEQRSLRYVMMQQREDFWEWLAEKAQEVFDEGYDAVWLDVTSSLWINHSDAYGVELPYSWDVDKNAPLDNETLREYTQAKIDWFKKRFPEGMFMANSIFPRFYFENGHERHMLSGENGHTPIDGVSLEFYANVTRERNLERTTWPLLVKMQMDMRDNNFRVACWVKKEDVGTDWDMARSYQVFAYATHLLVYEPQSPQYWGGQWPPKDDNAEEWNFEPPDFVYWDFGKASQTFATLEDAELKSAPGVYARQYEKGMVLVNPDSKQTHTIQLDEQMYDTEQKAWVTQVELKPLTGALLLKRSE